MKLAYHNPPPKEACCDAAWFAQADVERRLPAKMETLLFVGMSEMQRELYKSVLTKVPLHVYSAAASLLIRLTCTDWVVATNMSTDAPVQDLAALTGRGERSSLNNLCMQLRKVC